MTDSMTPPPSAGPDHSVRVAWADDCAAIARLQVEAWSSRFTGLPAENLPDPAQIEPVWRQALTTPGDARRRALVALDRQRIVGFAVTGPGTDPDTDPVADAELTEFVIAEGDRGLGHGSRLLQATADTLRADRFTRARVWLDVGDDAGRRFLAAAGWATDSAHRELEIPHSEQRLKQVRLHTDLT